ncbi:MAG: flavodoxin family protein [Anaerovoracaceae bacterium]|jgi:multimeric flavodoxin WrbA
MKICALKGSPRKEGNTNAVLQPFLQECRRLGHDTEEFELYEKEIHGCVACRTCQQTRTEFGCVFADDAVELFDAVRESDLIVLATPIYAWYCTPPMKALLDRFIYGFCKFYGEPPKTTLWEGKKMALVVTCGYPPEKGADLFAEGMKRYCRHAHLQYQGMLAEHDPGYHAVFLDDDKIGRAVQFADRLLQP